jgi:hypothetical protein
MNMRDRKRAALAMWAPPVDQNEAEVLATLTQVRRARVDLLRQPGALAEIRSHIKAVKGHGGRSLRKMLAEDLKLMRRLDRQERMSA